MKKVLVAWIVFGVIILTGLNVVKGMAGEMTDYEIMSRYVSEEFGEGYYGAMMDKDTSVYQDSISDEEDRIEFVVYCNGKACCAATIGRDWYKNKYSD